MSVLGLVEQINGDGYTECQPLATRAGDVSNKLRWRESTFQAHSARTANLIPLDACQYPFLNHALIVNTRAQSRAPPVEIMKATSES